MADINLLPEELREKEEKELKSFQKPPKLIRIPMSSPAGQKTTSSLTQAKPSLLSRLFSRKTVAGKPIVPPEAPASPKKQDVVSRDTEKIVEIPKAKSGDADQVEAAPYRGTQRGDFLAETLRGVEADGAKFSGSSDEKLHRPTEK